MRTDPRNRSGRGANQTSRPLRRVPDQAVRPLKPGAEFLYGRNVVTEVLAGRRHVHTLFVAAGIREDARVRHLLKRASERRIPLERPTKIQLDDMVRGANHQGILIEADRYPYAALDAIVQSPGTVLLLDHLQDPQNLGTLLRAAEASGISGVVIPADRAVAVTPAVVSASAGAVEHLRIAQVPNLARSADALKQHGWWIVGLVEDGENLYTTDLPGPLAVVVGGEGFGIGPNVRRRCDLVVSLPMKGKVESLNAATTGSIVLYELLRRSQLV